MNRVIVTFIIVGTVGVFVARSQSLQPQDDLQSWNEVQLTIPLDKKYVELYTAVTGRFGKNITRLNDGRVAIGVGIKPTKSLTILPFYWYIRARNSSGQFRNEHRLNVRASYKFPIKQFGLTHRSTYEYRFREATQNSWRYRAGLTFEKELPKSFVPGAKFYLGDEVFYDSLLKKFSRNRFTIGVNKTLTKQLSVDIYYMRQNDGNSRPGDLNVIGTTWRIKM